MIFDVYDIYWVLLLGVPLPGFIYATRPRFYKSSSWIRIRVFLLLLQVIFESLCLSTSLMGRARYTNPRVPEGHTHVSSPRDSIRVADSGWVSKLQIFDLFNSSTSWKLRFLQSSTSSIFDFNSSTSWNLRFIQFLTSILRLPKIFGFLNPLSRWEWMSSLWTRNFLPHSSLMIFSK
jgi:hypothetical protein